jgi:hypothetical protein
LRGVVGRLHSLSLGCRVPKAARRPESHKQETKSWERIPKKTNQQARR